jgi:hypothetical protein
MEQLCSHWKHFHKIWYLRIFRKSVEKIQVSLKSEKNNGALYTTYTFMIISRSIILEMRNVSDKCCREIKTRILCPIFIFEYLAVYELMWKKHGTDRQATDCNITGTCALHAG